ncbi:MAG: hypothetical protein KIT84_30320 [Labilithrix sp.]|nr:hypothetical protein [Labilithrix sp.]MCW5815361.1 hypothetical protein [Labilithrix sp.]
MWKVRIATIALVAAGAAAAAAGAAGCSREAPDAIPHVRLGMAPRDVRERFQPGGAEPGAWQTALGAGDDTVLEWTARDPASNITEARFEFHLGMLVAIRAKTKDTPKHEEVSTTAKTVTVRTPSREGATITVLARDCPTHHDEAEGYFQRRGSAPAPRSP